MLPFKVIWGLFTATLVSPYRREAMSLLLSFTKLCLLYLVVKLAFDCEQCLLTVIGFLLLLLLSGWVFREAHRHVVLFPAWWGRILLLAQ